MRDVELLIPASNLEVLKVAVLRITGIRNASRQ